MDLVLAGLGPLSFFAGRQKSNVCTILNRCRDEIGCRHVAHIFKQRASGQEETYISVTYPGRWLLNYAIRNYFAVDPVIRDAGMAAPVRILNPNEEEAAVRAMFADAQSFGIGRSFVDFQVMPHSDYPGTVMFTFDVEPGGIEAYVEARRARLLEAARNLHLDTMRARGLMPQGVPCDELNNEEMQCIAMIAEGRTYREIGERLSWHDERVAMVVAALCERLGCANPLHVVTHCLSRGLLRDLDETFMPPRNVPLSTPASPAKRH
ncbi:MAG: autoinducer binding domain-containing protein [Shinella sp.]|nr:autoinducer binding domain-containing protein [Shinella sp.]